MAIHTSPWGGIVHAVHIDHGNMTIEVIHSRAVIATYQFAPLVANITFIIVFAGE
jgi:hypothetical protein